MRVFLSVSNLAPRQTVERVYSYLKGYDVTIVEYDSALSYEEMKKRLVNCDMLLVIPSEDKQNNEGEFFCGKGLCTHIQQYMAHNHSLHDGWNRNRRAYLVSETFWSELNGDKFDHVLVDAIEYASVHDTNDWKNRYGIIFTNNAQVDLSSFLEKRQAQTPVYSKRDQVLAEEKLAAFTTLTEPMLAVAVHFNLI
jgi:hypothetical protein